MFRLKGVKKRTAKFTSGILFKQAVKQRLLRVAICLNEKLRTVAPNKVKLGLAIFILLMSVLYTLSIKWTFEPGSLHSFVALHSQQVPRHWNNPSRFSSNDSLIKSEYERIISYERMLDSIKRFDWKRYDSLVVMRPGLFDTLQQLKSILESP